MSLAYLQQGNVKKSPKLMKIVRRKCSYLPNAFRNFNEIFRKYMPYDNIKSRRKKQGLYAIFKKYSFGKTTRVGGSN